MATASPDINIEQIITLTCDQVNGYLERYDAEHPCEACGHHQWTLDEDNGRAMFVSAPLAHQPTQGLVFLPLTCEKCSNTRLINAANIALDVAKHELNNVQDQ